VIVHETDTGYAQGFKEDAYSGLMGNIELEKIKFSKQVQSEWSDGELWTKLLKKEKMINPNRV
jgi:6-pyruvoyltetrahydropterin/6-carboxytetrahydropterin synthase